MIEKKVYVCEGCCKEYGSPEACSKCETSHVKVSKIVKSMYYTYVDIPHTIEVELQNGGRARYTLRDGSYQSPYEVES